MRRIALPLAAHAALLGVIVLTASLRAQSADRQSTIGEISLPGGLTGAMATIGDAAPPDRAQFLVEFIRRTYDTRLGARGDPRETVLRSLLTQLNAADTSPSIQTLPLPLSEKTWTDVVLGGRATRQPLVSSILESRSASLLYCALLSLDDDTRAWFDEHHEVLAGLADRHAVEFLAAAPGLRIAGGTVRLPGGGAADPIWHALAGTRSGDASEFLHAVMESDDGRLARFLGAAASLSADQLRLLLNLDAAEVSAREESARRVYSVYQQRVPRTMLQHAFARPLLDPVLLAADLAPAGAPASVPGTRAFWSAAFAETSEREPDTTGRAEGAGARANGPAADFAWLCEQVFGNELDSPRRYTMVLFASRRLRDLAPARIFDAIDAVRGAASYPALTAALERARVSDIDVFAAAVRRAAAIASIEDDARQQRALTQFQGALALMARAASRGTVNAAQASDFARALAAIPLSERGDYEGRVAGWLDAWVRTQAAALQTPSPGTVATDSAEQVIQRAPGPFERAAVRLLAGAAPAEPRVVEWEGTRYRVDLRRAEAMRMLKAMGDAARPYVSSAATVVAAADSLGEAGLTRERLRQIATDVADAARRDEADESDNRSPIVLDRDRAVVRSLERAAESGKISAASRLGPALRVLADGLTAQGLLELAYSAALGERDGLSISAANAAKRHDFALRPLPRRGSAWQLPMQGIDANQRWRVAGSLLGLDAALADFSLVRLSSKPPRRPMLSDTDRRTFIDHLALVEPHRLTDADRDALVAAIRRGRSRVAAARTPADAASIADAAGLGAIARSLLPWVVAHDPDRVAAFLSPRDLFWLGLDGAPADGLQAWGMPPGARFGCLCVQMPGRRPSELLAGRWNAGLSAAAFPDLNLRITELLSDLRMPAALLGPVLAAATLDFINAAISRDPDDRRGLVEYVNALGSGRVEDYLALLTTGGPLVPMGADSAPRRDGESGVNDLIPGARR